MTLPVDLSSTRAQLCYMSLPVGQRPLAAEQSHTCPHGTTCFFNIDLGCAVPARIGDVYAFVRCQLCANVNAVSNPMANRSFFCTTLNNLTDSQRADLRLRMSEFDLLSRDDQRFTAVSLGMLFDCRPNIEISQADRTPRDICVWLFIEPNTPAITSLVSVPDISCFLFRDTDVFPLSNADGTPPTLYDRYLVAQDEFTTDSGVLVAVDISQDGRTQVYRRRGIRDWECPNLFQLREGLQELRNLRNVISFPVDTAGSSFDVDLSYDSDLDESSDSDDVNGDGSG
ncbi:hypothetical protein B0H17DRAFT_1134334 [Mycena rosella]|uniref:Uncharacterized protein n=1 Tax=Mycena rosella TaxID=1033263 RepID=A0AAD7DG17_MYCRO|nr:hypothetical protein B0H17DRAFT_1134334 [Mycena rosella]